MHSINLTKNYSGKLWIMLACFLFFCYFSCHTQHKNDNILLQKSYIIEVNDTARLWGDVVYCFSYHSMDYLYIFSGNNNTLRCYQNNFLLQKHLSNIKILQ